MNSELKTSVLDDIERLVESRKYDEAIHALDVIRVTSRPIQWSRPDLAKFLYFRARSRFYVSRYKEARRDVRACLRLTTSGSNVDLHTSAKMLHGSIDWAEGDLESAVEQYLECYLTRKRLSHFPKLYGPLQNIGLVHLVKGDLHHARETFAKALQLAAKFNGSDDVLLCATNLATAMILAGEFGAARSLLSCHEHLETSEVNKNRVVRIRGWLDSLCGDYESATANLRCAMIYFEKAHLHRDAVVCREFLAQTSLLRWDIKEAISQLKSILQLPNLSASAVAQTLRMLAEAQALCHNWSEARRTIAAAEKAIGSLGERIELGAMFRVAGMLCCHEKELETARQHFGKSISLLVTTGARFELALTYRAAALADCFGPEERTTYLHQAMGIFKEIGAAELHIRTNRLISGTGAVSSSANTGSERRRTTQSNLPSPTIIASSPAMKEIIAIADKVKDTDLTILITGETGTGKDVLAHYIHATSKRGNAPFVPLNCAAVPDSMTEAELFGYRKGSYTGAAADKPGLIELAEIGTFFFDEIAEASEALQAKLLHVIENRSIRRLGETTLIDIRARFIAATNRNLAERVEQGKFRSDLYFRLNESRISLPPLRERREDIAALLELFLAQQRIQLSAAEWQRLQFLVEGYLWPGNARELRSLVKQATALSSNGDWSKRFEKLVRSARGQTQLSREKLREMLSASGDNLSRLARELGISESTLRYRLRD